MTKMKKLTDKDVRTAIEKQLHILSRQKYEYEERNGGFK